MTTIERLIEAYNHLEHMRRALGDTHNALARLEREELKLGREIQLRLMEARKAEPPAQLLKMVVLRCERCDKRYDHETPMRSWVCADCSTKEATGVAVDDESYDTAIASAVFDILVADCGAIEDERSSFVYHITHGCREYRCCHALGFGGKFYPQTMSVDYYPEDTTAERDQIQAMVNKKLKELVSLRPAVPIHP